MNLRLIISKLSRYVLWCYFRFDKWHTSPLWNRQYAVDIVKELNQHPNMNNAMEIGCGLGDILSSLSVSNRTFCDVSSEVLCAAQFINSIKRNTANDSYIVYDFLSDSIFTDAIFDVIVIVNWIHGVPSGMLRPRIDHLINNNMKAGSILVFDVFEKWAEHPFCHTISELIDASIFELSVVNNYRFGRKLVYAKLK